MVVCLWWCSCGGVLVVVFLWWCCGGGVGFCGGVVVFLWWCGVLAVVVLFFLRCFCGGVVFLWLSSNIAQSSTEVMAVCKDCHQTSPKVLLK